MLGIWALTLPSVQGALLVMINHGISTGALFFLAGMLYERRHTRLIEAFGGIAKIVPLLAAVLTVVSLSSIGLPGTNGFVGEFLILIGAFRTYPVASTIAAPGVIVAAMYLLGSLASARPPPWSGGCGGGAPTSAASRSSRWTISGSSPTGCSSAPRR